MMSSCCVSSKRIMNSLSEHSLLLSDDGGSENKLGNLNR